VVTVVVVGGMVVVVGAIVVLGVVGGDVVGTSGFVGHRGDRDDDSCQQ
jgi:hypothetical protein